MLQKLENAYLAILRFLVIAVASVLLIAVVILGFNSFKAFQFEPVTKEITPQVSEQELIKGITQKPTSQAIEHFEGNNDTQATDWNMIFYERAATVIITFVSSHPNKEENVEKTDIIKIIKERANSLDDPKLVVAFARGFAESIEKTLRDKSVNNTAQTTSPVDVVNKALDIFTEKFNEQIAKGNDEYIAKQRKFVEGKAEGMQSLYVASGAFVAFLMIVFLSIIIRIERNLRHLENKPAITT